MPTSCLGHTCFKTKETWLVLSVNYLTDRMQIVCSVVEFKWFELKKKTLWQSNALYNTYILSIYMFTERKHKHNQQDRVSGKPKNCKTVAFSTNQNIKSLRAKTVWSFHFSNKDIPLKRTLLRDE